MAASMTYVINGIETSEEELEKIADSVSQIVQEDISVEELVPKLQKLKQTAQNFENQYLFLSEKLQNAINAYQNIENIEQSLQPTGNDTTDNAMFNNYNNILKELCGVNSIKEIGQQLYSSVFLFQAALNEFFNQEMVLTIVYGKYDVYVAKVDDYSQYLQYEIRDGQLQGRFNSLKKLLDGIGATKWSDPTFLTEHYYDLNLVAHLQHAKNSTMWRYAHSRNIITGFKKNDKEGKYNSVPKGGLVLWHRPNWVGVWIYNRGDIQEAYASALLDRELFRVGVIDSPFGSPNIDDLLDSFIWGYILSVDSASGALHGDFSSDQGEVQYAIKSARASALSYTQFHNLAEIVLNNNFNPTKIQQWADRQVKNPGKHAAQAALDEIVPEILEAVISGATAV